jgi:hypothetical protein
MAPNHFGQLTECCNCEALLLYTANILTSLAYATSMPAVDLGAPHGQPGRGLLKHWSSGFPQPHWQARTAELRHPGRRDCHVPCTMPHTNRRGWVHWPEARGLRVGSGSSAGSSEGPPLAGSPGPPDGHLPLFFPRPGRKAALTMEQPKTEHDVPRAIQGSRLVPGRGTPDPHPHPHPRFVRGWLPAWYPLHLSFCVTNPYTRPNWPDTTTCKKSPPGCLACLACSSCWSSSSC